MFALTVKILYRLYRNEKCYHLKCHRIRQSLVFGITLIEHLCDAHLSRALLHY